VLAPQSIGQAIGDLDIGTVIEQDRVCQIGSSACRTSWVSTWSTGMGPNTGST